MYKELFSGPKGIHFMRQTDCLSFASQYFNNGFNFFEHRLFNLKNIDGRAVCEFPITYYLSALLFNIFGKSSAILKLIHLIISYIGIYYIFRLSNLILKNVAISIIISLFFFTSTVFNYYSFNYLPDSSALGFNLIGLYYIFKYYEINKTKSLITSFLFFTLGGLIKITYAINPISIIIFSLYSILIKKKELNTNIDHKKVILFGGLSILVMCMWNFFILYYNTIYKSHSFNTNIHPLWNLTKEEIYTVWDTMINYWNSEYFYHPSMIIIVLMSLIQIVFNGKSNKQLLGISFILLLGCISYFVLFYSQFSDHDYYILAFFPLLVMIIINGTKTLLNFNANISLIKEKIKLKTHVIIIFLLLPIIFGGIRHSRIQLNRRYTEPFSEYSKTGLLIKNNLNAITNLNLPSNSKFIVAPDPSQNGGFFFLDKEGWNIDKIKDVNEENISALRNKGANFLLLVDEDNLIDHRKFGKTIYDGVDGIKVIKLLSTKPKLH